jgi:VCBS repeat-containing protein
MKTNSKLKSYFTLFILINSLIVTIINVQPTSAAASPPNWPDNWILLDTDDEDPNCKDYRDVLNAYYNISEEFLFLRLECVEQPNFTKNSSESRYKWFFDLDNNITFSGQSIVGAEYLLFIEDFDNHTIENDFIGDIFLLKDTNSDGLFKEWEDPPEYYTNSTNDVTNTSWSFITDKNISDYNISGNYIDLYLNLSEIENLSNATLIWGTDNENSNLEQAPGDMVSPPEANDDAYSICKNCTLNVPYGEGILQNDYDDDNLSIIAILDSNVLYGNLTLNDDGSFLYIPNLDFVGIDFFTYHIYNDYLNSNIATVNINVSGINYPPIANPDTATTNEDKAIWINVLSNDSDIDGILQPNTIHIINEPSHGSTNINTTTGEIQYIPDINFSGSDSFNYTVDDNYGFSSNIAEVSITVIPINDAPVSVNDEYIIEEDTILNEPAPGVLSNDYDSDSSITVFLDSDVTYGSLILYSNGSFYYSPNENYTGIDIFTYHSYDGFLNSKLTSVTITIISMNDAPIVTDIPDQTVDEDTAFTTINLDDYVSDVDNTDAGTNNLNCRQSSNNNQTNRLERSRDNNIQSNRSRPTMG